MKIYKITYLLIIFAASFLIFISGCQKAPINGKLDGMWEVKEIIIDEKTRTPNERVFYNFYMHVCNLTVYEGPFTSGNMTYTGDKIELDFPYKQDEKGLESLKAYGIYSNPVTFKVEFINDDNMLLIDGDITVRLLKF